MGGFNPYPRSVAMSCGIGHRHSSGPVLLWLWCRPAITAPIGPPAWEPSCALGVALKRQKDKKKKNESTDDKG